MLHKPVLLTSVLAAAFAQTPAPPDKVKLFIPLLSGYRFASD